MDCGVTISRRAACGGLLGSGAGLVVSRPASAQDKPAKKRERAAKKSRAPLSFHNADFYGPDGKLNEEAVKKAYLKLCAQFGYPLIERIRKDLAVTDYGLGRFAEVGVGFVAWVNDQKAGYASLEVFLLPNQMIPEHWQQAGPEGCILTEMSTYHTGEAVKFTDPKIKF